jgi:hypothetical protein
VIHSESIAAISSALARAQAELEHAEKNANNPHFRSKYASLDGVVDTIKPTLSKYDLAVVQGFIPSSDGITLETMIVHKSGEWVRDEGLHLPADKKNAQGFGSAATYARRYALMAMLGVAPSDDDDGNAASTNAGAKPVSKPVAKPVVTHQLVTADQATELEAAYVAAGKDPSVAARLAKNCRADLFVSTLKKLKATANN